MNRKTTNACCLFVLMLFATSMARAQFLQYIPGASSYINSDVRNELGGLTFLYTIQDSTLTIRRYLIHTDNAGQPLAMKVGNRHYSNHIITSDSSMILSGFRSTSAGNRIAILQKNDKNGNVLWIKSISNASVDVGIGNLMEGNGDTILLTATRSSFSSSTYYSRSAVMAFTGTGTHIWTKPFANGSFTSDYGFSRAMLASNGDFIGVADIRGSSGASANGMMITRIKQNGTIVFSKYFNFLATHNQLSVTALTETASGKIIFGGRLMTDQISTVPNSMFLAQLDDTGKVLLQKTYARGANTGEQLHSLRTANGKTYASVYLIAPDDSVRQSFWIGELDETNLSFIAQRATALSFSPEDPYGNVANAFCITSDGKPTLSGGAYCAAIGKTLPMMLQYSASLAGSCPSLDTTLPMMDSVTNYPVTNYVTAASVSLTVNTDTTQVALKDTVSLSLANLCAACAGIQPPTKISKVQAGSGFSIYPNPGDGLFTLDLLQPAANIRVVIYNNLGAVVYHQNVSGRLQTIDLSNQTTGVYYIKVSAPDGTMSVSKLVKDR